MSKENYLVKCESPYNNNIVIIPASIVNLPSPKRPKLDIPMQCQSPQHVDLSFLDDFNVDEIVECLNNCDNNDNTIHKTTEVNDKNGISFKSSKQKVTVLCNENQLSIIKNNDKKSDIINVVDSNKIEKITLNQNHKENELNDRETIKNILDTENNKSSENNDSNTLFNLITMENTSIQQTFTEVEIIEKDKNCVKTKHLDNMNKIELAENCQDTKEPLHLNNKIITTIVNYKNEFKDNSINLTQNNTTNINSIVKNIREERDMNGDKEFMKESNDNRISVAGPKSVTQCKNINILSKKLEKRMFDYLHIKYSVELLVHCGRFSKIFKCRDSAGKQYAVKILNNQSDRFYLGLKKEKMLLDMQADIPKENLFCVYCTNSFSLNGYWCFLMDFYPKNLKQAIEESHKPFHIDLVQDLARQLVSAVTLLRNNNIVHSDIKPSHILLNSSNTVLKLCGFDRSYYIEEAFILPNIGSVNYRPPEVILGYSAGFSVDVWSTALLLHEMVTGRKLFPGYFNWDILYKQMCMLGNIPPDMLHGSYYKTRYFVDGMFKKRFGIKGEKTVLMYKFVKNDKLSKTIFGAYYNHWATSKAKTQKDTKKINSFLRLLEQMLVIHPNYRITIEFVYANPFIYEIFGY